MICRIWRGIAPAEKADECIRALESVARESCLSNPGIDGVIALKRAERGLCEILLISLWSSVKMTGELAEQEKRGVAPGLEGQQALVNAKRSVDHYEVVFKSTKDRERREGFFNESSPIGIIW